MSVTARDEGPVRILMVDDDVKLCRLVRDYLQPLGYEVTAVHDGASGVDAALNGGFAAVLLDIMLPGVQGIEVLRRIRESSQIPVLMLTGLGEEADRILGLELGADDYLPKTFSTRELLARLRAVIRRSLVRAQQTQEQLRVITLGDLRIDTGARMVEVSGVPVTLTGIEFDLLLSLAKSAGRVKSREQLLLEIAERNFEVFDRSIDVHISSLRRKLGDDAKLPRFIVTVRGTGYMIRKPGMEEPA